MATANVHSGVVVIGLAFIAGGFALVFNTFFRVNSAEAPSYLWPIVGGLSLAIGAALVGIGMNRWTAWRSRPHRTE